MTKSNLLVVVITIFLIGWAVRITKWNKSSDPTSTTEWTTTAGTVSSNVTETAGKQEITIEAWNGYNPKITMAKANMPTELKIQWKNAYGCESAVRIPALKYSKNLEANWSDVIQLVAQAPWTVINGTCSMGMYNFQIKFN